MNRPGICPNCGKDLGLFLRRDLYGSPFRTCPKCKKEYVDRRYKELAILPDGIDGEMSYIPAVIFLVVAVIFVIRGVTIGNYDYINGSPVTLSDQIIWYAIGGILFILAAYEFIVIKFGIKKKKLMREYGSSVFRLCDINYARKLSANGFNVPNKYLNPTGRNSCGRL